MGKVVSLTWPDHFFLLYSWVGFPDPGKSGLATWDFEKGGNIEGIQPNM